MSIYIILVKDYIESESESEKGKTEISRNAKVAKMFHYCLLMKYAKRWCVQLQLGPTPGAPPFVGPKIKKKKKQYISFITYTFV